MKPIEYLKQNAPVLFQKYARIKLVKIEQRLRDLRIKYVEEIDEKRKKQIVEEGKELKKELEELKVLMK